MIKLQAYAATRLGALAEESLFRKLARDPRPTRSLQMLRHLTFWSNTFQDITSLNLARVGDASLRAFVGAHQHEDAGHDLWFNDDLLLAFGKLPDVVEVFEPTSQPAREVCYELIAEVFRAESDWERAVLPIALEEGGKVFLPRMIAHFERVGLGAALSALGTRHAEGEAAHTMHNDASAIEGLHVPDEPRRRCIAMIERVTETFRRFAIILERAIDGTTPAAEAALAKRLEKLVPPQARIQTSVTP